MMYTRGRHGARPQQTLAQRQRRAARQERRRATAPDPVEREARRGRIASLVAALLAPERERQEERRQRRLLASYLRRGFFPAGKEDVVQMTPDNQLATVWSNDGVQSSDEITIEQEFVPVINPAWKDNPVSEEQLDASGVEPHPTANALPGDQADSGHPATGV